MHATALQNYLIDQLESFPDDKGHDGRVRKLIAFVDENGYLSESVVSIAELTGERAENLERSLRILQDFRPIGVGARHLRECLHLQAKARFPPDHVIHVLIERHLPDIEAGQLSLISERTGIVEGTIKEAVAMLRNFDPKPGESISRKK